MVGLNQRRIISSLQIIKDQNNSNKDQTPMVKDYNIDNVSIKIVRIIESYTDYINRVVWKKY